MNTESKLQEMGNLDYFFLAPELDEALRGGWLNQIYDTTEGFRLKFRKAGELNLLVQLGLRAHLTHSIAQAPKEQTSFTRLLRDSLANARVEKVTQFGFDRILKIQFSTNKPIKALVFEQFGEGNVLALGEANTILRPLRGKDYSARSLHKNIEYQPPKNAKTHPDDSTAKLLSEAGTREGQTVISRACQKIDLPPFYVEEACCRASIDPLAKAETLSPEDWEALSKAIFKMPSLSKKPTVYFKIVEGGETPFAFSPFPLEKLKDTPDLGVQQYLTFNEALEAFYTPFWVKDLQVIASSSQDTAMGKLLHTLGEQEQAKTRFEGDIVRNRQSGEWIHLNFALTQELIGRAVALRKKGYNVADMERTLNESFKAQLEPASVLIKVDEERLMLIVSTKK